MIIRIGFSWFFVREPAPEMPAVPPGVTLSSAGPDDPAWRVLTRPAGARDTAVVRVGGEPAHVSAAFENPGGIVLGGSFTRPVFRGRGLYPLALRWLCARLARDGVRRVYISTSVMNAASRRGILAAGFRVDRVVMSMRVGPWDLGRWLDAVVRSGKRALGH
ncbi:MAG: GNAT family N-acetyltransferase [Planctomycetes bacterium]|nr:GNAT family N-acetyltransferase [Planctomycetota bacterium]